MSDDPIRISAFEPKDCVTLEIKLSTNTVHWLRDYLAVFDHYSDDYFLDQPGYVEAAREIDSICRALCGIDTPTPLEEIPF